MRETHDSFHLAIPARDLDEAYDFYVKGLGCKLARRYDDRITLDFFGDQVVCHLSDKWEREVDMYPRHFGVTFRGATGRGHLSQGDIISLSSLNRSKARRTLFPRRHIRSIPLSRSGG